MLCLLPSIIRILYLTGKTELVLILSIVHESVFERERERGERERERERERVCVCVCARACACMFVCVSVFM